jgi:mono/diheme cytochrome c family protein
LAAARRKRSLRAATLGGLALIALGTAGCSVKGADNANLITGKQVFVAKCGSCHTLARAETKGIVGPNLDEAFRAAIAEGEGRAIVRGIVEKQIQIPNPEGAMPKNLVSGSKAKDVAAYVAEVTAKPGKDSGLLASAVKAPGSGKPAEEKGGKLSIAANEQGDRETRAGHDRNAEYVRRLAQHRDRNRRRRRERKGLEGRREPVRHEGHREGQRQPEARHLYVLLRGPRAPRSGHVRHLDRQVVARRTLTVKLRPAPPPR